MNNKSESIAKLALALSKLQGEVTDAHKDKAAYNYKYADLAGVLEIARPLCLKYELAVSQLCTSSNDGVGVTTILMHSSGEWVESAFTMPLISVKGSNAAQAAGSVITYARRYSLAAILGITQIDNDASTVQSEKIIVKDFEVIGGTTKEHVLSVIKAAGISAEVCRGWCAKYGVERLSHLDDNQLKEIMREIDDGR